MLTEEDIYERKIMNKKDKEKIKQLEIEIEGLKKIIKIANNIKEGNTKGYNSGLFNRGIGNIGDGNTGHRNTGDGNTGDGNTGDCNDGDYNVGDLNSGNHNSRSSNSGNINSGNYNSGDFNSGDFNSGDFNSGDFNSGDFNSGNYNSGHYNVGHGNSGNYNSGDYNSGNYNSGLFNTDTPKVRIFNKETDIKRENIRLPLYVGKVSLVNWIPTDEENKRNKRNRGYYDKTIYKKAWREAWNKATLVDRKRTLKLPNFNNKIFKEITGIDVEKELSKKKG